MKEEAKDLEQITEKSVTEQGEEDFEKETAKFRMSSLLVCIHNNYPPVFKKELSRLYEKHPMEEEPMFPFDDTNPSPLTWLLLNNPDGFLNACAEYDIKCRKMYDQIESGKIKKLGTRKQSEIKFLREELRSYLLQFNFEQFSTLPAKILSDLYLHNSVGNGEDQTIFKEEKIDPIKKTYEWLLEEKGRTRIRTRISAFYEEVCRLDELLQEKNMYTPMKHKEGKF